jgi:hypothetical protein
MKWIIVEERVWEVEAEQREDALRIFKESDPGPPAETNVSSNSWWTEERCNKLSEVICASLEKRIGAQPDSFNTVKFLPWIEKAKKVVKEVFDVVLELSELEDDDPVHGGRWFGGGSWQVGVWLYDGYDEEDDHVEWYLNIKEEVALKILVLGGF